MRPVAPPPRPHGVAAEASSTSTCVRGRGAAEAILVRRRLAAHRWQLWQASGRTAAPRGGAATATEAHSTQLMASAVPAMMTMGCRQHPWSPYCLATTPTRASSARLLLALLLNAGLALTASQPPQTHSILVAGSTVVVARRVATNTICGGTHLARYNNNKANTLDKCARHCHSHSSCEWFTWYVMS